MNRKIEPRKQVRTALKPDQIEILKDEAFKNNVSLSEYLRKVIVANVEALSA